MIELRRKYLKCPTCGRIISYRAGVHGKVLAIAETVTADEEVVLRLVGILEIYYCAPCLLKELDRVSG